MQIDEIKIDPEFRKLLPFQSDDERRQLQDNILSDGAILDPLIVWREEKVLLDGHTRLEIVNAFPAEFTNVPVEEKSFADRKEAELWIINHQLGRRNLKPNDFKHFLGLKYNATKPDTKSNLKQNGKKAKNTEKSPEGHSGSPVKAEDLAEEHNVSVRTVNRAGKFATALESIAKNTSETAAAWLKDNCNQKQIASVAALSPEDQPKAVIALKKGEAFDFSGVKVEEAKPPKKPPTDPFKTQRSKTVKTAEALIRAFEDLHELAPNSAHSDVVDTCKELLSIAKGWK